MATAKTKTESVFKDLVKAAQRYSKTFEGNAHKLPPPGTTTEAQLLREQLNAANRALRDDLVERAQRVATAANSLHEALEAQVMALEKERSDSERRRTELAEAAAAVRYDWRMEHRQDRDSIGPFTIEHKPQESVIKLGSSKISSRSFPSGAELFQAVRTERARLESAAMDVWPTIKATLVPLQVGPDTAVPWSKVAEVLGNQGIPFRRLESAVIFALAWLRAGGLEPGWVVSTRPPTLSQQGKRTSVVLPRIDRPGSPEKIAAIRLDPPRAA